MNFLAMLPMLLQQFGIGTDEVQRVKAMALDAGERVRAFDSKLEHIREQLEALAPIAAQLEALAPIVDKLGALEHLVAVLHVAIEKTEAQAAAGAAVAANEAIDTAAAAARVKRTKG